MCKNRLKKVHDDSCSVNLLTKCFCYFNIGALFKSTSIKKIQYFESAATMGLVKSSKPLLKKNLDPGNNYLILNK